MLLALVCSLGHLRSLANPPRALCNVRSSWLSREILFGLLFLGSSTAFAVTATSTVGSFAVPAALAAAASGLGLLVCMASVYRIRTVPAWDTSIVMLSFLVTSGLLGCLTAGTLLEAARAGPADSPAGFASRAAELAADNSPGVLPSVALAAALLLALQLWLQGLWLSRLRDGPEASRLAWLKIHGAHGGIPRLRSALAAGAALLALAAAASAWVGGRFPARPTLTESALISALVLASVAELLGRILLYRAKVRQGL
jgi:anaerobic dimethyl sulfoxide reductase subunit C (anchor subunit)